MWQEPHIDLVGPITICILGLFSKSLYYIQQTQKISTLDSTSKTLLILPGRFYITMVVEVGQTGLPALMFKSMKRFLFATYEVENIEYIFLVK